MVLRREVGEPRWVLGEVCGQSWSVCGRSSRQRYPSGSPLGVNRTPWFMAGAVRAGKEPRPTRGLCGLRSPGVGAGVVEAAADRLCRGLACSSCLLSPHFSEATGFTYAYACECFPGSAFKNLSSALCISGAPAPGIRPGMEQASGHGWNEEAWASGGSGSGWGVLTDSSRRADTTE